MRTDLELVDYRPVQAGPVTRQPVPQPTQDTHQGTSSGTVFEAVGLPAQPQVNLPKQQSQKRTAHLGFRVTQEYLDDVKQRTHLLVAMYRVPVDTVNLMILQEIAECFPAVEARIQRYLRDEDDNGATS